MKRLVAHVVLTKEEWSLRELIKKLDAEYGCNLSESEIDPIVRQAQKANELQRSLHTLSVLPWRGH
jgi:hypothetical protein